MFSLSPLLRVSRKAHNHQTKREEIVTKKKYIILTLDPLYYNDIELFFCKFSFSDFIYLYIYIYIVIHRNTCFVVLQLISLARFHKMIQTWIEIRPSLRQSDILAQIHQQHQRTQMKLTHMYYISFLSIFCP